MENIPPRSPAGAPAHATRQSQLRARRFYVGLALFMIVIVFAGFWPSYFGQMLSGAVNEWPWVIHLHAAVFVGFMVLLLAQALLVSTGRTKLHMKLGTAGIAFGVLVVMIGLLVSFALPLYHLDIDNWEIDRAARLLLVGLCDMAMFAILFGAAIAYRRRPETHKRLIVLAAVAIILPAASRLVHAIFGFQVLLFLLVWWSPVLLAMGYDLVTRRRIHPAYFLGFLILFLRVASQFLVIESESGVEFGRSVLAALQGGEVQ